MNCVKINALVTAYDRVEIYGLGLKCVTERTVNLVGLTKVTAFTCDCELLVLYKFLHTNQPHPPFYENGQKLVAVTVSHCWGN